MGNIAVFILMLLFIYLYTYIIGGETSMFMLYLLMFSPIVSSVLTFAVKNRIKISIEVPTAEVEKDGTVKVDVTIINKSFIPVPYIDILFIKSENLSLRGMDTVRLSLGSFQTRAITTEYMAAIRGVSRIGIRDIVIRDYMGLFKLSLLKNIENHVSSGEITVLPRIINIKSNKKILMSSYKSDIPDNSGESSSGIYSFAGEPGYEFREYIPGDSLHKIHWKLSAKKEVLMVRKDEARGISRKRLIIDPSIKPLSKKNVNHQEILMIEEKTLEAFLSIANVLVKEGKGIEVWLFEEKQWVAHHVSDTKGINELQHRLAAYKFSYSDELGCENRMPLSGILESAGKSRAFNGGEAVVFSGNANKSLMEAANTLLGYKMSVDMVLINSRGREKASELSLASGDIWTLDTEQNIEEAFS